MPYFLLFSQLLPRTKNNILLGNFGDYFQPLLKQKNFRTIKSNNIKIPDNCDRMAVRKCLKCPCNVMFL